MKRLHILTKSTASENIADLDADDLTNMWHLKAERLEIKRLRKFKHSWA